MSTLRRIYDEVSSKDQRAEWARVDIGWFAPTNSINRQYGTSTA